MKPNEIILSVLVIPTILIALTCIAIVGEAQAGLKDEAAKKGTLLGCGVKDDWLKNNPAYVAAVTQHCGSITAQVETKATHTWKQSGNTVTFDFSEMQYLAGFAGQRGMELRAHAAVWFNAPDWVNGLSNEQIRTATQESLFALCRQVPGIDSLDVISDVDLGGGPFERAFGPGWVKEVYDMARDACPGVELVLNFFNTPSTGTVNNYRSQGVEFDTVGLEFHLGDGFPGIPDYGIPLRITEFDQSDSNSREPAESLARAAHGIDITVWNLAPVATSSDPGLRGTPLDGNMNLTAMGQGLIAGFGGQITSSPTNNPPNTSRRNRRRSTSNPPIALGSWCFPLLGFCL